MIKTFVERFQATDLNGKNFEAAVDQLDYRINKYLEEEGMRHASFELQHEILQPHDEKSHDTSGWQRVVRTVIFKPK